MPQLSKNNYKKSFKRSPLISIIIPARNEEDRIKRCISTLKSQTYTNIEVIIVDDFSTDNTIEVAENAIGKDKRFRILKLKFIMRKKPISWIGKSYALQQGSTRAKGKWLLLCDVDETYHDPQLIEITLDYVIKNKLDSLSLVPHHICKTFWEKVIQPIPLGLIIAVSPLTKSNVPKSKIALAFGCFILIKHSVFKKIGGYKTIKDKIADDVQIARLVKSSGFKIGLGNGQRLLKIRMYKGFKEIWNGWSKNIFLGLIQNRQIQSNAIQILIALAGALGIFIVLVFPFLTMFISLLLGLLIHFPYWRSILFFSFFIWLFSTLIQFITSKRFFIGDPKYVPLTFLGGIITIGMFLNSAFRVLSGRGVTWKGRVCSNT